MKHRIFVFITLVILTLLQISVFPFITFIPSTPNLLLGFTLSLGLMRGFKSGLSVGVICGFILDLFTPGAMGAYALIYGLIGFASGACNRLFYQDELKFPLFVVFTGDILYGIIMYFVFFMMRSDFGFGNYFLTIILPEAVCTLVCMIALYPLVLKLEHGFLESERQNAKKFV